MPLAHDFVAELKDKVDLYDRAHAQLKKSGSSWVGLSPFSQEKTLSFLRPSDKGFQMLQLGEKGEAVTFVQKMENLSFMESRQSFFPTGSTP